MKLKFSLRTQKKKNPPAGAPGREAPALDEALGGCEKLMKVGNLASREVSCACGRMQELKDCNYSIIVEVDWIRDQSNRLRPG